MKPRHYAPDRVGRHDTAQQPGDGPRRDPPPARREEADRPGGDNDCEDDQPMMPEPRACWPWPDRAAKRAARHRPSTELVPAFPADGPGGLN
jgi:hypothetical protein